jgi:hypothetical protein
MNPIADLKAAIARLDNVPGNTPVELAASYGAPPALSYDERAGLVRLSVGGGSPAGRPTMAQLRAWFNVPQSGGSLQGPWDSARALEPFTWRGVLVMASALASGYHGVRRNGGSVGWGILWFAMGAALPGLTPLVAVAQGYGDCANNCRLSATERR